MLASGRKTSCITERIAELVRIGQSTLRARTAQRRGGVCEPTVPVVPRLLTKKLEEDSANIRLSVELELPQEEKRHLVELLKRSVERDWPEEPQPEEVEQDGANVYVVGSWFLHESYNYLKRFDSESLHYVTGPVIEGQYVLDTLLPVKMSRRSWASASSDPIDTHRIMQELDDFGHLFTCYFHTHPGCGASSTHPSPKDLRYQEQLEQGEYGVIGGIFSQDGYLRFFSFEREFVVRTYGLNVEQEGRNVFRLTQAQDLSMPGTTY